MTASCGVVFVLDDDPLLLGEIDRQLTRAGHAVEVFRSAAQFFERIAEQEPDGCLVLDLGLPETGGLEVQEKLVQRGSLLPIVFISGGADVRTTVRAMRCGAIDLLVKPFRSCELFDAVSRALAIGRRVRANRDERGLAEQGLRLLSPREREVCMLVAAGLLNKQIAAALGTSEKTIKVHRGRAMAKLAISSVAELVRLVDRASERRDAER